VIPLRPLTMSEIWSGVFATVRGNPAATLGLALLTTVVALVPTTLLAVWLAGQDLGLAALVEADPALGADPATDAFLTATLASYVPLLATIIATILLQLFMACVIGHAVRGRKVTLGETWRETRGRILPGIGVVLLITASFTAIAVVVVIIVVAVWSVDGSGVAGLVTVITVLAAVLASVYLWVRLGFAMSVLVLEGAGVGRSIGRSWRLTSGQPFWRIFGIRLLTSLVASIAGSVVATPLSVVAGLVIFNDPSAESTLAWLLPVTQSFAVLVQSVLFTPFVSGVDSLLYLDQRIRREGLDVQILQQLPGSPIR
jgi:hypothetical protein